MGDYTNKNKSQATHKIKIKIKSKKQKANSKEELVGVEGLIITDFQQQHCENKSTGGIGRKEVGKPGMKHPIQESELTVG